MSICSNRRRQTDVVSQCFTLECGTSQLIWISSGLINPCATISFRLYDACAFLSIIINQRNGSITTELFPGQSATLTVNDIESILIGCPEVDPPSGDRCKFEFCMTLHYECC